MKRFAWIAGILVLLIVVLVAAAPALISRESVKTRIAEQISGWTGRGVLLRGEPVVTLFPSLTVKLNDVTIAGPEGMEDADIVSMETLRGSVRLLPLLIGEVEIESFTMVRPQIRLVRNAEGERNWVFDSGAAALQLAFDGDVPLGAFTVQDGTLTYEDRAAGTTRRFDDLNFNLAWESVRRPIAMSGSAVWRDEPLRFEASASSPFSFMRGQSTPVRAEIASDRVAAFFQGDALDVDEPRLEGDLSLKTPSLRLAAEWLGGPSSPGPTTIPASLAGTATLTRGSLFVKDAAIAFDGNNAAGSIRLDFGTVPALTGTLAFPSLDLTPYLPLDDMAKLAGEGWREARIDVGLLDRLDADVRLSADSATLGSLALGEVAATVLVKQGALDLALAEAALYGGSLNGSLSLRPGTGGGSELAAQMRANGFNIGQAAAALGLAPALAGTTSVEADVRAAGATLGEWVANLDGTVAVDAMEGALPGIGLDGLATALRAGNAAPLGVEPGPAEPNATPFRSFDAAIDFADRAALVRQAALDAQAYAANATGRIGLETGALDLTGALALAGGGSDGSGSVPFTIAGTLSRPDVKLGATPN